MTLAKSPRKRKFPRTRTQSASPPTRKRTRAELSRTSPPQKQKATLFSVSRYLQSQKKTLKRARSASPHTTKSSSPTRKRSRLELTPSSYSSWPTTVREARNFLLRTAIKPPAVDSERPATTYPASPSTHSSTSTNLLFLVALNNGNVLDYEDEHDAELQTASDHPCYTELSPPASAPLFAPAIPTAKSPALDPDPQVSPDSAGSHDSDADSENYSDISYSHRSYMPNEFWESYTYEDLSTEIAMWTEAYGGGCLHIYADPCTELWESLNESVYLRFGIEWGGGLSGFWQHDDSHFLIFRAKDGFYFADVEDCKATRQEVTKIWRITESDKKKVRMWLWDQERLDDLDEMENGWRYYGGEHKGKDCSTS